SSPGSQAVVVAPEASLAEPPSQLPDLAKAETPKDVYANTWDDNSVHQKTGQPVSGVRRLYQTIMPTKKAPKVTMLPGSQALVGSPQDSSDQLASNGLQTQMRATSVVTPTSGTIFDGASNESTIAKTETMPVVGDIPVT